MATEQTLDEMVASIRQLHSWTPPLLQIDTLLSQFETEQRLTLPSDLKEFYRRCGEVELFDGAYRIMSFSGFGRASLALTGEDSEDWCPSFWYVFCERLDGDYVGIDLSSTEGGSAPLGRGHAASGNSCRSTDLGRRGRRLFAVASGGGIA